MPDRFEKQLKVFENGDVDICSSWVGEFEINENKIMQYRRVPKTHAEIVKFAKKRNPLNHPSVIYKKSAVFEAGNYQKMIGFEDYYLWVRMLLKGYKMANIQESLVNMQAGYHILERRGGWNYIKNEVLFQKRLEEWGFINYKNYK